MVDYHLYRGFWVSRRREDEEARRIDCAGTEEYAAGKLREGFCAQSDDSLLVYGDNPITRHWRICLRMWGGWMKMGLFGGTKKDIPDWRRNRRLRRLHQENLRQIALQMFWWSGGHSQTTKIGTRRWRN